MRNDGYQKYVLEDLDPEEAARRARARQAYETMYQLNKDDPYGAKRLERVRTTAGVTRVFNQVAHEMGLGGLVDGPDSEQSKERLEPREIDRNAYCRPTVRQVSPHEMRARRKLGWTDCRFVLPRPILEGLSLLARSMADRENAERAQEPRGQRRRSSRHASGWQTPMTPSSAR